MWCLPRKDLKGVFGDIPDCSLNFGSELPEMPTIHWHDTFALRAGMGGHILSIGSIEIAGVTPHVTTAFSVMVGEATFMQVGFVLHSAGMRKHPQAYQTFRRLESLNLG